MDARIKTAAGMVGSASVIVLAVEIGVSPVGAAPSMTAHASSSVAGAAPSTATPARSAGVHVATLAGCVAGLDC